MLDTLESVKTRLGITTADNDAFLTEQIELISDTIEAYCRRRFLEAEWIQTFYRGDYIPSKLMELFHYPLVEVTSIEEDGEEVDVDSYRLHKPTGRITRTIGTFFWADETVVTYTAGTETCPRPVLSVLDSLVQERYNKKLAGVSLNFGSDVQRVSIPGAISIDFDYTLNNNERSSAFGSILGNFANVLDSYRTERAVLGSGKLEYVEEEDAGP